MKIGPFRKNFVCHEYEAGHMMYIDEKELAKLQADVAEFLKS
jgi:carboxypeptidase C (cathepsin A)